MKKIDLQTLETELKKRWAYKYIWLQKQNDLWDGYTNYIYTTQTWEALITHIAATAKTYSLDKHAIFYYASNRWYNFWSAMAVEHIFNELETVTPALNKKDSEKDFYINDIPFDHKTSVFPKRYNGTLATALENPTHLITWLYEHQSTQKRHHLKNRLFIVVHNVNGEHWKMKAELSNLKKAIVDYIASFNASQLIDVPLIENEKTLADIIWVLNDSKEDENTLVL